ncbi:hypothetical protein CCO03_11845 [Comamonas serinivorans]|uniref:DUF2271 domain-containing protein n=1 Tax=Comamonas serinivorans TaxID=1082851 RepID=A0A1Y0EPB1_9BURK|nr:DUF2271 domain-containing protein [Comamonas serinivorans]ARU05280.1 hypothetical protein CCO03_11845 [Comamonas serinivorans]
MQFRFAHLSERGLPVPPNARLPRLASLLPLALGAGLATPVLAGGLDLSLELPRLNVSEYHRPYVAAWIEKADNTVVSTLTVWYQTRETAEGHGTKWLKDMRQWWRRTGRELTLPIDGVSMATKPVGKHQLSFSEGSKALPNLAAGSYKLVVEAAREVGGREVVSVPFDWPPKQATTLGAAGKEELGDIRLTLKP